jgi:protein arginine kinase
MSSLDTEHYLDQTGEWLKGEGPESDIVISSRARLARNVEGFPFSHRASGEKLQSIQEDVRSRLDNLDSLGEYEYVEVDQISDLDTSFLAERHLISSELAEVDWERGVAVTPDERVSIMVNEEDHLRIQSIRSGCNLEETWEQLNKLDDELESFVKYAFSPKYGYLTACPTNAGTALRVSVMLHLPVLNLANQMDNVFQSLSKVNFTSRGLYGEGTQASGDLYQISNQVTMNKSEEDFINQMNEMIPEIVKFEREWRDRMLEERPTELKDRIYRAAGTLSNAYSISSDEATECLSALRLGISLDLIDMPLSRVNRMFLFAQPAHLQKKLDLELNKEQRDQHRASYLRESVKPHL